MPKFRVQRKLVQYETMLVEAHDAEHAKVAVQTAGKWHRFERDPNTQDKHSVESVKVLGEVETGAKQFSEDNIYDMGTGWNYRYIFSGAMVSTCAPLLDDCEDNYDVTRLLEKNHVVRKGTRCDPESCSVYFNFKTRKSAYSFIQRLNKFLKKRYDKRQKRNAA